MIPYASNAPEGRDCPAGPQVPRRARHRPRGGRRPRHLRTSPRRRARRDRREPAAALRRGRRDRERSRDLRRARAVRRRHPQRHLLAGRPAGHARPRRPPHGRLSLHGLRRRLLGLVVERMAAAPDAARRRAAGAARRLLPAPRAAGARARPGSHPGTGSAGRRPLRRLGSHPPSAAVRELHHPAQGPAERRLLAGRRRLLAQPDPHLAGAAADPVQRRAPGPALLRAAALRRSGGGRVRPRQRDPPTLGRRSPPIRRRPDLHHRLVGARLRRRAPVARAARADDLGHRPVDALQQRGLLGHPRGDAGRPGVDRGIGDRRVRPEPDRPRAVVAAGEQLPAHPSVGHPARRAHAGRRGRHRPVHPARRAGKAPR